MWFLTEEIDNESKNVVIFLANAFKISEQTIIEYCKKMNFNYVEMDMNQIVNDIEYYKKYSDLVDYISQDINTKDKEKLKTILTTYQMPEIKLETVYTTPIADLPSKPSYSNFRESLRIIANKLKKGESLTEDNYFDIDVILNEGSLYQKIPKEIKNALISSIDDGYKKHYFEKNIGKILKKYYKDSDFWERYEPRLNGIPLDNPGFALTKEAIHDFFTCKDEDVSKLFKKYRDEGLYYIYSFIILISSTPYFHSFLVPEYLKKRISELDTLSKNNNILKQLSEQFDKENIQNFEKQQKNTNTILTDDNESYHLSKEFINQIIQKIPAEYNKLEKTLYVYYFLCYIFTYDNYYYSNDKIEKNMMRKNMFSINEKDNEVVCYQFASAFKDVLNTLEIKTSNLIYNGKEKFYNTHQSLKIYVDEMLLDADSTRRGADADDLSFVKIGKIGNGIRCEMFDSNLQERFHQAKNKVSKEIKEELNLGYYQEIEDDLRAFENIYGNKYVNYLKDKSKKFSLIFYEISRLNLSRVDSLALYSNLYDTLFSPEEKEHIKYKVNTTDLDWSININIGSNYIYYNFDTKQIDYNIMNNNLQPKF